MPLEPFIVMPGSPCRTRAGERRPPGRHAACCSSRISVSALRLASHTEGSVMPYILGWFLGVPLIVLVILYLIFH